MGRVEDIQDIGPERGWDDYSITIQCNPINNKKVFAMLMEGKKD